MKNYDISFITTNYDLLLEKILYELYLRYHYLRSETKNSVAIKKLHGSISWFSSSQGLLREYDNYKYKSFFQGEKEGSYVYDFSNDCLTFPTIAGVHMQFGSQLRSDNVVPIFTIIPPFVGKEYNDLFRAIIGSIEDDFREFNYFVIVGYSFPDADPLIKNIIMNFYKEYDSRDSKVICINDNKKVCEKITQFFGNKIETIGEKWSIAHFKKLFI